MILQITETLAPVIESASKEPNSFTLLFMLLVIIAVCVALVKVYNDNRTIVEKLSVSINNLSNNVAANTTEAKENRVLLEKINDLIRDRV
jgi:uncharacterized protein YoxC